MTDQYEKQQQLAGWLHDVEYWQVRAIAVRIAMRTVCRPSFSRSGDAADFRLLGALFTANVAAYFERSDLATEASKMAERASKDTVHHEGEDAFNDFRKVIVVTCLVKEQDQIDIDRLPNIAGAWDRDFIHTPDVTGGHVYSYDFAFRDVSQLANGPIQDLLGSQLNVQSPRTQAGKWLNSENPLESLGGNTSFWGDWYHGFVDGEPIDWDLQLRIATTLTDEDWDKGATHVADRIAEIRAKYETEQAAEIVANQLNEPVSAKALPPRGHNNPPEIITNNDLANQIASLRQAVDTIQANASRSVADKNEVEKALEVVVSWHSAVLAWLGRKADLAVDTAIRWAIPAGGGYLLLHPAMLQKLIEASKVWLPFIN